MSSKKLPLKFYTDLDVVAISRALLGKYLVACFDGAQKVSGMIVETEAYRAPEDRASHAYNNRRTLRTETMFERGGVAYVYLCYGMHHLFNIVTGPKDIPHAVLVRAIEPKEGIDCMLKNRGLKKVARNLTGGPAMLSQALGVTTKHNGVSLRDSKIWVEDRNVQVPDNSILASPRVGVAYAKEDAKHPWRFRIKDNPWTSLAV